MSFADYDSVSITASTAGAVTGYTKVMNGRLHSFEITSDIVSPVLTLATTRSGITFFTATLPTSTGALSYQPRLAVHSSTGGVVLDSSGSADPASGPVDHIVLSNERVKITCTSGTSSGGRAATVGVKVI